MKENRPNLHYNLLDSIDETEKRAFAEASKKALRRINFNKAPSAHSYINPYKSPPLHPWPGQTEAAKFIQDHLYSLIIAKWGYGKGKIAVLASILGAVSSNNSQRHLFSAPMTDPCEGYCTSEGEDIRFNYEETVYTWCVANRFFNDDSKIGGLKGFLTGSYEARDKHTTTLIEKSAAITHNSLVRVWGLMSDEEKRKAVHKTTFILDECHHCKSEDDHTKIGLFLTDVMDINDSTCRIVILTATYHRGDDRKILSPKHYEKFSKWSPPLETYLMVIGIDNFNFDFITYKKDPLDTIIENMKLHRDKKHIVILPSKGQGYRKFDILERFMSRFSELFGSDHVLDMVTQEGSNQKEGKKKLKIHKKKYNVVVACNLFTEGYDWPPAAVLHNTAPGESLNKASQIMGRLFRKYKDKREIWHYTYLRCYDNDNLRQIFSDRLNSLMLAIMISDILKPIHIPLVSNKIPHFKDRDKVHLLDIMSEEDYKELTYDILRAYETLDPKLSKKEKLKRTKLRLEELTDKYYRYVKDFLDKETFHDVIKGESLRMHIIARGNKESTAKIERISIDFIREKGFDEIWEKEQILGSLVFGTMEPIEKAKFNHLKKIMNENDVATLMELNYELEGHKRDIKTDTPVPRVIPSIDYTSQWIHFKPENNWEHYGYGKEHYAFVTKQDGPDLEIIYYKGEVEYDKEKIYLTVEGKPKSKTFVYCGKFWRLRALQDTLVPWNVPKKHCRCFLYNEDSIKRLKKAPQIQCTIPSEWVNCTLTVEGGEKK